MKWALINKSFWILTLLLTGLRSTAGSAEINVRLLNRDAVSVYHADEFERLWASALRIIRSLHTVPVAPVTMHVRLIPRSASFHHPAALCAKEGDRDVLVVNLPLNDQKLANGILKCTPNLLQSGRHRFIVDDLSYGPFTYNFTITPEPGQYLKGRSTWLAVISKDHNSSSPREIHIAGTKSVVEWTNDGRIVAPWNIRPEVASWLFGMKDLKGFRLALDKPVNSNPKAVANYQNKITAAAHYLEQVLQRLPDLRKPENFIVVTSKPSMPSARESELGREIHIPVGSKEAHIARVIAKTGIMP